MARRWGSLAASGLKFPKDRQRAAPGRLRQGVPSDLLSLPVRKGVPRLRPHLRDNRRQRHRHGRSATVAAIMVEPNRPYRGAHPIRPKSTCRSCARSATGTTFCSSSMKSSRAWVARAQMFAAQTFGVTPDVICTGKGLSGGFIPLFGHDLPQRNRRQRSGAPSKRTPALSKDTPGKEARSPALRELPSFTRFSNATCAAIRASRGPV